MAAIPRRLTGTLKDAFCALSPFGPQVTERTRQAIAEAQEKIIDGSLPIYRGPIRDNTGQMRIAAGVTRKVDGSGARLR